MQHRPIRINTELTAVSARFEGYRLDNAAVLHHALQAVPIPAQTEPTNGDAAAAGAAALNEDEALRWRNWHLISRRQHLIPHQDGYLFVDPAAGRLYRVQLAGNVASCAPQALQLPPGDSLLYSLIVLSPSLLLYCTGVNGPVAQLIQYNAVQQQQPEYSLAASSPLCFHSAFTAPITSTSPPTSEALNMTVVDAQLTMVKHRLHVELVVASLTSISQEVAAATEQEQLATAQLWHITIPLRHGDSDSGDSAATLLCRYDCRGTLPQFCRLSAGAVWIIGPGTVVPVKTVAAVTDSVDDTIVNNMEDVRGAETEEERELLAGEAAIAGDSPLSSALSPVREPRPAYSWTQTAQDLTIYYPLQLVVDKTLISIQFHRNHIDLQLPEAGMQRLHEHLMARLQWKQQERRRLGADLHSIQLPHRHENHGSNDGYGGAAADHEDDQLALKRRRLQPQTFFTYSLYGPLKIDSCYWTVEYCNRDGDNWSILALHLEKADHGTRWPCVFHHPSVDEDILNVPETLDPNELVEILERMEKYTAPASQQSNNHPSIGGGRPQQRRQQTMQEIADLANRKRAEEEALLWETTDAGVDNNSTTAPTNHHANSVPLFQQNTLMAEEDECDLETHGVRIYHFNRTPPTACCYQSHADYYLGQRMVCLQRSHHPRSHPLAIGLRHGVDLCEFDLEPLVEHRSICPAIGFVQASKRSKKCILFTDRFAFIVDQRKHIFVYQRPSVDNGDQRHLAQAIVDLGEVISTGSESGRPETLDIRGFQQISDWKFLGLTDSHLFLLSLAGDDAIV